MRPYVSYIGVYGYRVVNSDGSHPALLTRLVILNLSLDYVLARHEHITDRSLGSRLTNALPLQRTIEDDVAMLVYTVEEPRDNAAVGHVDAELAPHHGRDTGHHRVAGRSSLRHG